MPPDLTARVGEPSPVPTMTLDEIDKALAVCGRATKGPWNQRTDLGPPWSYDIYAMNPNVSITSPQGFKRLEDTAFTAHARTGYPAALLALKAAMESEAMLLEALRALRDQKRAVLPGEYNQGWNECVDFVAYVARKAIAEHAKAMSTSPPPQP